MKCCDKHLLVNKNASGPTRRQFIQGSLAMISTVATVPMFLGGASRVLAATDATNPNLPGVQADRILVVVQLSGGNDGLNTVIPYGDPAYYNARPRIGVSDTDVLQLGGIKSPEGIGLHPSLLPIKEMMQQQNAAAILGVGYPNPNRSHFASMDVWHRGDALTNRGYGWIGKAFDNEIQKRPDADHSMNIIAVGDTAPLAAEGKNQKAIAFERQDLFRWLPHSRHKSLGKTYDELNAESVADDVSLSDDPAAFLQRTAVDAQVASARVRDAARRKTDTKFPGHALARQLKLVANMIKAELPTRVYYVAMGGFDTHAGQGGRHRNLLRQFAESMQAFQNELAATGHAKRVVTFAFSEFGRRVEENASGGTDHGAAGPSFLFGEPIRSGVLGEHPSLTKLDRGDLTHTVDFRNIYAALLGPWMGMDVKAALGKTYRPVEVIRS